MLLLPARARPIATCMISKKAPGKPPKHIRNKNNIPIQKVFRTGIIAVDMYIYIYLPRR